MRKISGNIKLVIILLVGILCSVVGVTAATLINGKGVTYDNTTSQLNSTNLQDAINELYNKADTTNFKVGDYVSMTPTKTTFTIPMTLTGYTENQTINPSELNLWRVIKINDNGTIDMVSEYISSSYFHITGLTGYKNYVGVINYIVEQYENKKYTVGSRGIGYDGQTEYLTDTSKLVQTTSPWQQNTDDDSNETLGGGDRLYRSDIYLLTELGLLKATQENGEESSYWIASRRYIYYSDTKWYFAGAYITKSGSYETNGFYYYDNGYKNGYNLIKLRPIVTLKSNIKAEGLGTSESPYILN